MNTRRDANARGASLARAAGAALFLLGGVYSAACLEPAHERVELDRKVGSAEAAGVRVEVSERLAGVRAFDGSTLSLWAQAPALTLHVEHDAPEPRPLHIELFNVSHEAVMAVEAREQDMDESTLPCAPLSGRSSGCSFDVEVAGNAVLTVAVPEAPSEDPFVFAVLGDVQRAIGEVNEVFARMNEDPEISFVVSSGDLVNTGSRDELEQFQDELALLRVPYFSTVGNHELGGTPRAWHELFGPFNVHFSHRGVVFSLVDDGNATIDPDVYGWLDGWLDDARDATHAVFMHIPPLDPVGVRGGGFRSRKEAAKLMQRLAEARVDALFLGHIHSYYAFSAAGVPSYISGGGGAIPERFDGIGRHYLRVRASRKRGIEDVAVVRVD
jgi:Icc protein